MYVHLGIRYIDIVLGKCLVNLSIKIIIDIPKTIYRSPCPHKNIDRTISQRMKSNEIRRFTQNTGIGLQKLDQNFLSRFIAISVTDTESPLHTTQTGTGIIDNDIVRQISIRYEYRPVITRNKDSIETRIISPPAKFCNEPLNAILIATPAEANNATNEVVLIPKIPMINTIRISMSVILIKLRKKDCTEGST